MIINIYSVYDRLAEQYGKPMFLQAKVAQRNFDWMAKENTAENCADKEIRELGVFDDEKGQLVGHEPVTVYNLEAKQKEFKEASK